MRLDKYLQIARLVKRREVSRELAAAGRLLLNGHPAKPGKEVRAGDTLGLAFWRRLLTVRVSRVPAGNVPRGEAHLLYEVLQDLPVDEDAPPPG